MDKKLSGSIEVVTGPMFAGKSEELIRRIRRLEYAKKTYLVFKPTIDDRYSKSDLVSHLKNKVKSICINKGNEIYQYITDKVDAVIVDEVQFLDDQIVDVCDDLANKGIRVIVGGLDMDFKGEPFMITARLLAKAEFVTKLTAICVKCGEEATRTQRLINGQPASEDDPVIVVGASESYESRCRHCHEVLRK